MDTQNESKKATFLDRRLSKRYYVTVALILAVIIVRIMIAGTPPTVRLWSSIFRPGFTRFLATTSETRVEEVLAPEYHIFDRYLRVLSFLAVYAVLRGLYPEPDGENAFQKYLRRNSVRNALARASVVLLFTAWERLGKGAGFPYFYGGIPFILAGLYMVYDIVHFRRTYKPQEETPTA